MSVEGLSKGRGRRLVPRGARRASTGMSLKGAKSSREASLRRVFHVPWSMVAIKCPSSAGKRDAGQARRKVTVSSLISEVQPKLWSLRHLWPASVGDDDAELPLDVLDSSRFSNKMRDTNEGGPNP